MNQSARKKKKRSALFAPVSFLIVCAALALALSVFFRVSTIEVRGNSFYTSEEVVEASGIETGDNLFFLNRFTANSRIFSRLPYVETASVDRVWPGTVVITVTESSAIACVTTETGVWVIDRTCKLLAEAQSGDLAGLIRVEGITPIAPDVGEIIAAGDAEKPKVNYLAAILRQISDLGMQGDVTYIDISNVASPSFDYLGRFTVKLGTNDDLEYKFQVLLSAVDALAEGDRGTLDLSIDRRAHLTYD